MWRAIVRSPGTCRATSAHAPEDRTKRIAMSSQCFLMPRPLKIVPDHAEGVDRILFMSTVDRVVAELRLLEQARQPADGFERVVRPSRMRCRYSSRGLARTAAEPVAAEDALHPRIRRDYGAARIGLGLEIVDRIAQRAGDVVLERPRRQAEPRDRWMLPPPPDPRSNAGEQEDDRRPEDRPLERRRVGGRAFSVLPLARCEVIPEEELMEPGAEMDPVLEIETREIGDRKEWDEDETPNDAHLKALVLLPLESLSRLVDVRVNRDRRHQQERNEEDARRPIDVSRRCRRVGRVAEPRPAREGNEREQDEQREQDARDAEATPVALGVRLHASGT